MQWSDKIERVDGNLWRGPKPDSLENIAWLKDQGFEAYINLNVDDGAIGEWCEVMKLHFINFDIWAILPPSKRVTAEVLDEIEKHKSQPLLLGCRSGRDRTGFILAKYRMQVQGWSAVLAKAEFISRCHAGYCWWKFFL